MHPLIKWREDKGLSLDEAAKEIGVPRATFTDWIYCRRLPRPANLELIREQTGVSATAILNAYQSRRSKEAAGREGVAVQ